MKSTSTTEGIATLIYSHDLEPGMWSKRHAQGDVPGYYPYGLHRIADCGMDVETETVRPARRSPWDWTGLINPGCWAPRPPARDARVALAWDESVAVPMFIRHRSSERRLMAGVIWATDQVQSSRYSPRLSIIREVYRRLDAVWVLSRAQISPLQEWLGVPQSRLHFLPFGIDTGFFPQAPLPERPMVLSMGNDRDRDPATLFEAMRIVRSQLPETRLVVQSRAGLASPAGVELIQRLSGRQVRELYTQASVVAIATKPNLHVSGMTTALEAMSVGRPVVLSHTEGAADYVREGVTGRLVAPGDPKAMANAILKLLSERELLRTMSNAAAAHVQRHHSETTMASALVRIARS